MREAKPAASLRSQLMARKSIESLQADAEHSHGLKRTLGAMDLVLLGIGAIIGTGIFVLTGRAAAGNAGPAVALSFIVAGVASVFAGLCYAEMASMIPVAGSAYTYAYATLGEFIAWIIGWDLILEYLVAAAAVSVGWSGYVGAFVQHLTGKPLPQKWSQSPITWAADHSSTMGGHFVATGDYINLPATLIVLAVTVILVVGIRESARFNAVIVFVKLAVVLAFVAFGVKFISPENWHPFIPKNEGTFGRFGISGIFQGATMVFFSYIGFDAVSTAAQETRNPQRDVPIGILGSLSVCTVLYIAVSMVLTGLVPYTQLNVPHPIAVGIAVTGIGWLETAVEVGAIAGLTSVMLVMLMGQPRIFFSMAVDGLFPQVATKIHPRFGTPYITTIITGVVCAITGGLLPIEVLAELTSIGTLFAFVLVSLGVMMLRIRQPGLKRVFRVPGGTYLVPLLGAFTSGLLMCTATVHTILRLFIWLAIGLVIYFAYSRPRSKLRALGR